MPTSRCAAKHTKASVLIKHAAVLISLLVRCYGCFTPDLALYELWHVPQIAAGSGVLTSRRVEAWADPLYLEALSIVNNPGDSMAWILLGRRQLDAVGGDPSKIYNNATVGEEFQACSCVQPSPLMLPCFQVSLGRSWTSWW